MKWHAKGFNMHDMMRTTCLKVPGYLYANQWDCFVLNNNSSLYKRLSSFLSLNSNSSNTNAFRGWTTWPTIPTHQFYYFATGALIENFIQAASCFLYNVYAVADWLYIIIIYMGDRITTANTDTFNHFHNRLQRYTKQWWYPTKTILIMAWPLL